MFTERELLEVYVDGRLSVVRELMLKRDDEELTLEFVATLARLAWATGVSDCSKIGVDELIGRLLVMGFGLPSSEVV